MKALIKNDSKLICYCLIMSCILLIGFTGCNSTQATPTQPTPTKTIPTPETEPIQTTPSQTTPVINEKNEDQIKMDIKNFTPIQQSFIKYNFNVKLNGTATEPISFFTEGKYDLNQDGRLDNINLQTRGNLGRDKEIQTYIKVNEIKQDFYMDFTCDGEVRVIDLDKNDKFIEVAIFDEGPSGDPHYTFYRFDGEKLYDIGSIDSNALVNGEGKLISSFNISRFTPKFYSAWCEINNNAFVQKSNDIERYLGKSYKFDGGEAYFIPTKEMPRDFIATWGESKQLKASDVKIIDVYFSSAEDRTLNYYFVEFPSGEKGMLYFWIGD